MNTYKSIWCIQSDNGKPGDSVPVTLKSGKNKTVTLGAEIMPGVFLPVDDAPKVDTSAAGFKTAFNRKAQARQKMYEGHAEHMRYASADHAYAAAEDYGRATDGGGRFENSVCDE